MVFIKSAGCDIKNLPVLAPSKEITRTNAILLNLNNATIHIALKPVTK